MRKVIGLALTTVLLLSFTSCSQQSQSNENRTTTAPTPTSNTSTPPSNTSPPPPPPPPTTATVKNVGNSKWQDDASGTPVTTIKVGGTVTWITTSAPHSLKGVAPTPENGCGQLDASFDTGNLPSGQSVTRTFSQVGTFGYKCGIHGGTPNCTTPPGGGAMPGVIKVVP